MDREIRCPGCKEAIGPEGGCACKRCIYCGALMVHAVCFGLHPQSIPAGNPSRPHGKKEACKAAEATA